MPIIEKSDENIRSKVREFLYLKKKANPGYKVLDVGGAANPWCDEYVDAYADINGFGTEKRLYLGDLNRQDVWDKIAAEKFDFSICTHVLEDIRDPEFVIKKLVSHTRAGFIAMPNKHTEMSCVESLCWVGYSHHRWIFTIVGDVLRICPKLPVTSYFSPLYALFHAALRFIPGRFTRFMRNIKIPPVSRGLTWVKKEKNDRDKELGFIWESGFPYEFINGDYAGTNSFESARLYSERLGEGL